MGLAQVLVSITYNYWYAKELLENSPSKSFKA